MRNILRFYFQSDFAHLTRDTDRFAGIARQRFARDRKPIRREHLFARTFGQRATRRMQLPLRRLHVDARGPRRLRGARLAMAQKFTISHRCTHRFEAAQRIAVYRHAAGCHAFLRVVRIVIALTDPEHRDRFLRGFGRVDGSLQIRSRSHRVRRNHDVDILVVRDGLDTAPKNFRLADDGVAYIGRIRRGRDLWQDPPKRGARRRGVIGPGDAERRAVIDEQHAVAA